MCVEHTEQFMNQLVLAQSELTAFVTAMLPFHAEAVADLVQETNLALVSEASRYDTSKPFVPWALTLAKQKIRSYLRDAKRERVLFSSDTVDQLSDVYTDDSTLEDETSDEHLSLLERLRECRAKLKDREKKLLSLFYDESGRSRKSPAS